MNRSSNLQPHFKMRKKKKQKLVIVGVIAGTLALGSLVFAWTSTQSDEVAFVAPSARPSVEVEIQPVKQPEVKPVVIKPPTSEAEFDFSSLINTAEEEQALEDKQKEIEAQSKAQGDLELLLKDTGKITVLGTQPKLPEVVDNGVFVPDNSYITAVSQQPDNTLNLSSPTAEASGAKGEEPPNQTPPPASIGGEEDTPVPASIKTSDNGEFVGTFNLTAYDLGYDCCRKERWDKQFGITASGYSLIGKSREEAMTVAVDPEVIELGTKLKIVFSKPYEHFSGIYTARDTGNFIIKNKIDIFMGDFGVRETDQSVWDFGNKNTGKVYIVK